TADDRLLIRRLQDRDVRVDYADVSRSLGRDVLIGLISAGRDRRVGEAGADAGERAVVGDAVARCEGAAEVRRDQCDLGRGPYTAGCLSVVDVYVGQGRVARVGD